MRSQAYFKAFEVKKFRKGTGMEVPGQFFGTVDRSKAEARIRELNAHLNCEEQKKFEFRVCEGPSRISVGS